MLDFCYFTGIKKTPFFLGFFFFFDRTSGDIQRHIISRFELKSFLLFWCDNLYQVLIFLQSPLFKKHLEIAWNHYQNFPFPLFWGAQGLFPNKVLCTVFKTRLSLKEKPENFLMRWGSGSGVSTYCHSILSFHFKIQTFSIKKQERCTQYEKFSASLKSKMIHCLAYQDLKNFCCTRFSFKTQFKIEILLPLIRQQK